VCVVSGQLLFDGLRRSSGGKSLFGGLDIGNEVIGVSHALLDSGDV
jgi:hypothetical protein